MIRDEELELVACGGNQEEKWTACLKAVRLVRAAKQFEEESV